MNNFDLDESLIQINSSTGNLNWTVRRAVEGVQIFGGIGSGKTSGSGRTLALKYLNAGFGGLILTVKPDEKEVWQEYCKLTNRINDLIVLEPNGEHRFNFLKYESSQGEKALTENIVEVLKTVIRAGEKKDRGQSDDAFWDTALDMLIFNVIDLCKLAYGTISIQQMYEIAVSIPKSSDETRDPQKSFSTAMQLAKDNIATRMGKWEAGLSDNLKEEILRMDAYKYESIVCEAIPEARIFKFVNHFFEENLITLNEKTRSIIDFTFTGFLFRLLREPVYSLFCNQDSTFVPDDCLDGKIILLNLPVKMYHKVGRDCQILFKYIWQRAMEKRDIRVNSRPIFLWADEAQNFLHEHDVSYQATARSSRIATVYITQNLANYYANMGGSKSEHRVISFLGTLATKIFHANADRQTNEYASSLIGDGYRESPTEGYSTGKEMTISKSKTYMLERLVKPEEFVSLRTGGPLNEGIVEAYFHCQGYPLFDGSNHKKVRFRQNL